MRTAMVSGAVLALTVFGSFHSARADTYQFKITGDDTYTFDLPSNPTPLGTTNGGTDFYLAAPSGLPTGDFVTFYDLGGLSAGTAHDDSSGTLLFDLDGIILYTPPASSPQFSLGTFQLSGFTPGVSSGHFDTLVISDISSTVVPLPTALPLFATGLVGFGLLGWRRKTKAAA